MRLTKPPPLDSELASELYCDEVLDGAGHFQYLDRVVSMSALPEAGRLLRGAQIEMEFDRREIHNGS